MKRNEEVTFFGYAEILTLVFLQPQHYSRSPRQPWCRGPCGRRGAAVRPGAGSRASSRAPAPARSPAGPASAPTAPAATWRPGPARGPPSVS